MKSLAALLSPRPQPKDMEIGVAWPGKRHVLKVKNVTKIEEVKQQIENLENIPVKDQILSYRDKKLKNHRTLVHYGIDNDRTIILSFVGAADGKEAKKTSSKPSQRSSDGQAGSESAKSTDRTSGGPLSPASLASPASSATSSSNHAQTSAPAPTPTPALAPVPVYVPPPLADDEIPYHPGHTSELTETYAAKENANDVVKIVVKHGKKEYKLKLPLNADIWTIKLQLEAQKVGRASELSLYDENEEYLDDEGTLDDFSITNGSTLTLVDKKDDDE